MTRASRLARLATATLAASTLVGPALVLAPAGAAPSPHGSCADVLADAPGSPDGEYEITSHGRTLDVWCAGMSGMPAEYLTLQRSGPGINSSSANINYNPFVQTTFTRVRLVLPTSASTPFTVLPEDVTFSSTTGGAGAIRYGQGGSCGYANGPFNIDLRGTPFAVDPADVVRTVGDGHGDVYSSDGGQVVWSPNARGNCGTLAIEEPFELIWTLAVLPVVTAPTAVSVTSGDDAVFTASSTGGPGTDVVWQTSADGTTWTVVPGATADALTLEHVTRSMDGLRVRAVYSNGEGTTTSAPAVLSVAATAPAVTAPDDVTVVSGGDAVFEVTVSGDPAPALQWELSQDGGTTWATVPGATGAGLSLPDVTTAQDGHLVRVRGTNEQGTVTSAAAELTVQALAPTVSAPADVTVVAGSDAAASVLVTGDPAPTVRWELSPDGTTWLDSGFDGATVVFPDVPSFLDGWRFRAVAESPAGTATSAAATLTVTALAPSVVSAPDAVTVREGEDATFTVEAAGDPEPEIGWQTSTDGQTWTDVDGETDESLVLEAVSADDDGLLVRALLENDGGTAATDGVVLSVVSALAPAPVPAAPVLTPAAPIAPVVAPVVAPAAPAARAVVDTLPRTGAESLDLAALAGLLVLGGGLVTVVARRRATIR